MEEVTCHNMWELSSKQWHAFSTYQPSRRQQWWLETIFPDEPKDVRFTLHSEVHANGYITRGDIVTFMSNGEMCIGELQANVGLATDASARMVSTSPFANILFNASTTCFPLLSKILASCALLSGWSSMHMMLGFAIVDAPHEPSCAIRVLAIHKWTQAIKD